MSDDCSRFQRVIAAIDAANAADPVVTAGVPRALAYGRRMSAMLDRFAPEAGEVLRIAARAQHIERWVLPRDSHPEGRIGYLAWRKTLQQHHARRLGELMRAEGYEEAAVARAGSFLRKERLKQDSDVQTLEDVICLVFLSDEAPEFIARHGDEQVIDILAKTARKMSPQGLAAAGDLVLAPRLARLLAVGLQR